MLKRQVPILALALLATGAARELVVPGDKAWQHARTGLILPASLDGLPRTRLSDTTAGEWDVAAGYDAPDRSTVLTLFLYHPAVDDVALWFEQSRLQIKERDVYGGVEATTAQPVAFAAPGPGGGTADALRQTFRTNGAYPSTALAVMPLGDWLVAVRLSARDRDTAALDQRLVRIVAGLRWPASPPPAPALHPIVACPDALAFEKASVVKSDATNLLLTLMTGSTATRKGAAPVAWCRDPATTRARGVYRPVGGATGNRPGYLIALGDAGRTIGVWPSIAPQIDPASKAGFTVSFANVDGVTSAYPSFDRLPSPDQAVALLKGPASGTIRPGADGKQAVTVNAQAL